MVTPQDDLLDPWGDPLEFSLLGINENRLLFALRTNENRERGNRGNHLAAVAPELSPNSYRLPKALRVFSRFQLAD